MDEKNEIKKLDGKKSAAEKKKNRRHTVRIAIIGAAVIALAVIALNWQTFFSPVKDIFLSVGTGGFPVSLPGSTDYYMGELSGGFYLLTDTYLYTYTDGGAEINRVQHGFNSPSSSSTDRRALIYDKSGKDFKVFSRSEEIFSKTMDDTIVFAKMGSSDRSAVVTTSTRYSNYLYIFSSDGKQLFRWASPEEKIMGVCFSDTGNLIYVSVVGEENGEFKCAVLCFNITSSSGELWRASTGSSIPYTVEYAADGIYTVTEKGAYIFDKDTGEVKAHSSFTRQVTGVCGSTEIKAVIFRDTATNGSVIAVYDDNLEASASLVVEEADKIAADGQTVYVLNGNELTAYDRSLAEKNSYQLDNDYSDFVIIGGKAFLLGYNTVQRVDL